MTICIIRGCGKPLPTRKSRRKLQWTGEVWTWQEYEYSRPGLQYESRLCNEHYAAVSEVAVKAHIERILAQQPGTPKP